MTIRVIGIDIAKQVFQVHGIDEAGHTVLRKKLTRATFLAEMAQHPACLIGLEAQQATLMLHRVRDHFIRRRTGAINALRGHLAEFGLVSSSQRAGLNRLLEAVEDSVDTLPNDVTALLKMISAEIRGYDRSIADLNKKLKAQCKEEEVSQRLREIPGVGPVIATAMSAYLAAGGSFSTGSAFAAWLGITPRQHSSGGKERTFGITKRGNTYLRRQLINGARAVVRIARGRRGGMWDWINKMLDRRHFNIVTVAVANKMARIMWAMITKGTNFRPV
ncbi:IS110 family transposase [Phaeobacter inhibens]|uniref:IS110 family transposase n=1 Tax=Phaeobacter inhibens TaxID=221822 RepID=UPI00076BBB86|nr:IS110 family transposase [Phaeobacter inhibens]KXF92761.1 hypothetical protein AT574_00680 [Phaeobacter inhibens]